MFLSDSLPSEIRFRQAYTLSFYLSVMGRVSPVPNHTFHTYRFLYTEGFFCAAFQFLRTFHGFRPYAQGSTPLCSLFRDLFLTIRQNSLNVTVCMIACTFYQGYFIHSLSTLHYYSAPSLATQLTGDYRDRTYTGKCGPASLDTLHKKRQILSDPPSVLASSSDTSPRSLLPPRSASLRCSLHVSQRLSNSLPSSFRKADIRNPSLQLC